MQKFSYHCHTNSFGIFDGSNSVKEMLDNAEAIGFEEIGISNHLICNKGNSNFSPMFFSDFAKATDIYKRVSESIREEALGRKIKVRVGFEVDFYYSADWRKSFEKMLKELDYDYLIGASHNISDKNEEHILNIYEINRRPLNIAQDEIDEYLKYYWQRIVDAIYSGYFDFMAHLDVCKVFGYCKTPEWDEYKWRVIEALASTKTPYEINASGFVYSGEQYPTEWMINELNKKGVPTLISDDAHSTSAQARLYAEAEELLGKLNYTKRWRLK